MSRSGLGLFLGEAAGFGVAFGVGLGVDFGVGFGVGFGFGVGVGLGVGVGVGLGGGVGSSGMVSSSGVGSGVGGGVGSGVGSGVGGGVGSGVGSAVSSSSSPASMAAWENEPGSIQTMSPAAPLAGRRAKYTSVREKQDVKGGNKDQIPPKARVIHESRQHRRPNRSTTPQRSLVGALLRALLASSHYTDPADSHPLENVHHFNELLDGQIAIRANDHRHLGISRLQGS